MHTLSISMIQNSLDEISLQSKSKIKWMTFFFFYIVFTLAHATIVFVALVSFTNLFYLINMLQYFTTTSTLVSTLTFPLIEESN